MLGTVLLLGAAAYVGWLAWRAHRNLVTLDVRDMEVRQVVKKIERQTWEDIHVHKEVAGKVTLKVVNAPLEEVLRIIGGQTQSRPALFYALYSNGKSLTRLAQSLRGEVDPATHGWTNLQSRNFGPGGFGGGPGMFGPPGAAAEPVQNRLVSLNLVGRELGFAVLAFGRFAQTRVVPEDGVTGTLHLVLDKATVPGAVAGLAKSVKRKWTPVYALEAGFGFGRGGMGGPGGDRPRGPGGPDRPREGDTNRPAFAGFGGPEMAGRFEEMRKQRETQEQELKQALPAAEREKYEQAQQERETAMRDMQNMTPEQMRDRFMSRNAGGMDRMMKDRVLNTTPEQRAQMQRQMQQRGPGPGGPGGPPR